MKKPDLPKRSPSEEEKNPQNKQFSQSYDSSINQSDKEKLVKDEDDSSENKVLHTSMDSPRSQLAKYIPDSPFKFKNMTQGNKIFVNPEEVNQSSFSEEDSDSNDHAYSKSCDYSEEIVQSLHHHFPITRSVSEDYLRPPPTYQRKISLVSTKGKLAGIPRFQPKAKTTRAMSIAIPPPPLLSMPARSTDEEELLPPAPFTTQKKLVAVCLCLVDFTAYLGMSIIAPFFPKEAAEKGMREAVSGFVFSIYALVVMISSPIFGKLMPYSGAKLMFIAGIALCGISNIVFGLLDLVDHNITFAVLCFVVRSFEAIGAAAFCTASCTILIDQFPDHIGTIFGFIETAMGVGMSIGPAVGGALYSVGGFSLPFYALGGCVLLIVPVVWLLLRGLEDPKHTIDSDSASYWKLLSLPHLLVVCFILVASSQALGFVDPTLEPHMRQYGLDAGSVGLLFLLLSGTYGLAAPIVGWISSKVKNKYPIMIIGLVMTAISLLLLGPCNYFPIKGSVWLSTAALGLLGISLAVAYIPTFEAMFIVAINGGLNDDIGTYSIVSGLWNAGYSLGEVTGPSLGGILADFLNFPDAATIFAIFAIIAAAIGILAWYNPNLCFGEYNIVEDDTKEEEATQNTQLNSQMPSRESTPLANGSVHTYGSLIEDRKNPDV